MLKCKDFCHSFGMNELNWIYEYKWIQSETKCQSVIIKHTERRQDHFIAPEVHHDPNKCTECTHNFNEFGLASFWGVYIYILYSDWPFILLRDY